MNLQFLKPDYLWFLLILLIPIIIHLFNFRKHRTIYFSNITFLENIESENKSKSNLKKILQLIARMLCYSFLVLAFCQPIISNSDKKVQQVKNRGEYYIYIDNSYSMNIEGEEGINIDIAKQKAINIVKSMPKNSLFYVFTNTLNSSSLSLSGEQAINQIQEIRSTSRQCMMSDIFKKYKHITGNVANKEKHLIIISDFQKSTTNISEIKLDTNSRATLIPLRVNITNNIYIDTCFYKSPEHIFLQVDTLIVKIKNSSKESFSNVPIKLFLDDSIKLAKNFSIKSESETTVKLKYKNTKTGIIKCKLSINDYPIIYDNNLFFNYKIDTHKKILAINSQKSNKFINALYTNKNNFILKNINISRSHTEDILKYQLVILNNIEGIDSGFANKLDKYLTNGGNLLFIPGKKVNNSINIFLKKINSPYYGDILNSKQKISYIEKKSGIYKKTFKSLKDDALMPEVYKLYSLKEPSLGLSESIWKSENNNILLSETKYMSGKCYVLSCSLNKQWTNVCTHKVFLPALWNMANKYSNSNKLYYTIHKDDRINIKLNNKNMGLFHISNIENSIDLIPEHIVSDKQESYLNIHEQINNANNYDILLDGKIVSSCSFNYSRTESDLNFYTLDDIKKFATDSIHVLNNTSKDISWKENIGNNSKSISLWMYFILACIFFYLFEIYINKRT